MCSSVRGWQRFRTARPGDKWIIVSVSRVGVRYHISLIDVETKLINTLLVVFGLLVGIVTSW